MEFFFIFLKYDHVFIFEDQQSFSKYGITYDQ